MERNEPQNFATIQFNLFYDRHRRNFFAVCAVRASAEIGATYVISGAAKKYTLAPPSQVRSVQDDLQDVDLIADESSLPLTENQPK